MTKYKVIFGVVVVITGSFLTIRKILTFYSNKNKTVEKVSKVLKVLFFPDEAQACSQHFTMKHGCHRALCKFSHDPNLSTSHLFKYLIKLIFLKFVS